MPDSATPRWTIVARPVGNNRDGVNKGGLVIELKHAGSGALEEVDRIGFDRANTTNPNLDFKARRTQVMETAREAVNALNEIVAHKPGTLS